MTGRPLPRRAHPGVRSRDVATPPTGIELDDAARTFDGQRRRLFGIAYRMLGNVADAEDVLQEVWLRWQRYDRSTVRDPGAFLAITTTRTSINAMHAARTRRETYIGEWLPSPVDTSDDPTLGAERGEVLELAVLMLMERLTPTERAAYVLREAFVYSYPDIGEIVQTTEANARQLVSRARRHLNEHQRRPVDEQTHRRLFTAFVKAAQDGDVEALEALLTADIVSHTDGSGLHRTARRPIVGKPAVIRFLHGVAQWFWDDVEIRPVHANGHECALLCRNGETYALFDATAGDDGIEHIMWIVTPDKLKGLPSSLPAAP